MNVSLSFGETAFPLRCEQNGYVFFFLLQSVVQSDLIPGTTHQEMSTEEIKAGLTQISPGFISEKVPENRTSGKSGKSSTFDRRGTELPA